MKRFFVAASAISAFLTVALFPASALKAVGDEVPSLKRPIFPQKDIGEKACGPCALYNCLIWGGPDLNAVARRLPGQLPINKVQGIIDRYGAKPSEEYAGKKPRFTESGGITWHDFRHIANDLLRDHDLPAVAGDYLDRGKKEKPAEQARRVFQLLRKSLDAGFPPLVSFRSFAANRYDKEYLWNGLYGHWVTLVELPRALAENEKGFRFGYLDPYTGKLEYGYAYAEEARNFTAAKGNAEKYEWINDRPFLLVTAPSLRMGTQRVSWYARTIITLNYAVYRGKAGNREPSS